MQGMQRIKDRILEDARAQAEDIIKEAEGKVAEVMEQASKEAESLRAKLREKGREEAEEARRRMLAMAELDIRKEELAIKQKLIDRAFDEALGRLQNLKGKEYKALVMKMVKDAGANGDEEIIVSAGDRQLFEKGLLKDINSKLGLDLKLSGEERNIKGGFILKSTGIEINNSFDTLIRMERDQIETQIAEILFQE